MIVGIDTGGTNVDAVLVDDTVNATSKVPGDESAPIERALERLPDGPVDRVVIATTLVLNATVQQRLPQCTNVLVPGPGLSPRLAFHASENHVAEGCVDHRGRVTEAPAYDGRPTHDVVAVTAKFGTRNPGPEREIRDSLDAEGCVALGNEAGAGLSFPDRAATTVSNARTRPTFEEFAENVRGALDAAGIDAPAYYLKGDGGMLSEDAMRSRSAHALGAGPAASAIGLVALTDVESAVCVDIGGTTTDVTRVTGGFPATERVAVGALEPGYEGVRAVDLPLGGDTRLTDEGLAGRREGPPAAFGGAGPTLTDALHVVGALDDDGGDTGAAREALSGFEDPGRVASEAVATYVRRVASAIDEIHPDASRLVAGGVLAPHLADRIAEAAGIDDVTVPEHAPVAGAVGCAAARVSVETTVHVDSARGTMTTTALETEQSEIERGRTYTDDEIETLATERAREAARQAGAPADSAVPVEVRSSRSFNVVENARVAGQVVDARAQASPGLARFLGGGS